MKLKNFTKSIAVFAMVLIATLCMGAGSTQVKAADIGYISSVQVTGNDKHAVTVSWSAAENATSYNVYYQEYYTNDYILAGNTNATNYTVTGLKDGTKYNLKVVPVNGVEEGIGKYCDNDVITLPDTLKGLKAGKWYCYMDELGVEWEKQSAADGYEVALYNEKGKRVSKKKLEGEASNYYYFQNAKNRVYTAKARSYLTYNGKKYYSSWSSTLCLQQARVTKATVSGSKLKVKWDKVAGATGYEIYVSTKPTSGYKKVATVSKKKNSCTVKKFKGKKYSSKKTYYVYVKTVCKKGNKKYGSGILNYWNTKNNSYGYL